MFPYKAPLPGSRISYFSAAAVTGTEEQVGCYRSSWRGQHGSARHGEHNW